MYLTFLDRKIKHLHPVFIWTRGMEPNCSCSQFIMRKISFSWNTCRWNGEKYSTPIKLTHFDTLLPVSVSGSWKREDFKMGEFKVGIVLLAVLTTWLSLVNAQTNPWVVIKSSKTITVTFLRSLCIFSVWFCLLDQKFCVQDVIITLRCQQERSKEVWWLNSLFPEIRTLETVLNWNLSTRQSVLTSWEPSNSW